MADRVILSTAPLRGPGLDALRELGEVVLDPWIDHRPLRLYAADQLAERAAEAGATVLISEADQCSGPVLELPLEAIGAARGEPTNVDLAAATAAGIPVLRAPGRNADAVAELTVGLALAATRGLVTADRDVREGQVFRDGTIPYQRFRAWQLAGRTLGLVGLGAVGRAARWRFEGLGMRVVASDPFAPDATHDLGDLLAEADVVSMHAAVTPDTVGLMSADRFAAMRPGAVYVNAARAALHDVDALVEALRSGQVGAAGLDHFEGEALATDHPLASLPNVVLTPHIGGATYDTEDNHTRLLADGLAALLRGEVPANLANPEVLGRG
jgi:D-3-phosphoglycerate dehydrogenase